MAEGDDSSMTYETIDVRPLAGALGAEVLGVDLAGDIGNQTFAEIQDAFAEHSVIFFRDHYSTEGLPEKTQGDL